jgi:anti-anti-sigma regulatory factor
MFRLTEQCTSGRLVLKLEGRCSLDVVGELEAGWQSATHRAGEHGICIDLSDVLVVDDAAREQLARMHRAGARFVSRGCLMRELIREITRAR